MLTTDAAWLERSWQLHVEHFADPWQERLDALNRDFGLSGSARLSLPHPHLPPPWFNGDIERLPNRDWVLVVSLNPHIDPADDSLHRRTFSPREWWDFWRTFNQDGTRWKGAFFPRLVRLAAACLGEAAPADLNEFAMRRMLFVEFCPYASPSFVTRSWHTVQRVAAADQGFRIARTMRDLLLEHGRPRLVLCNGKHAAWDVKDRQCPAMAEVWLGNGEQPGQEMQAWIGDYVAGGDRIPIIGFKQLGRRNSRPSVEAEIIRRVAVGDPLATRIVV